MDRGIYIAIFHLSRRRMITVGRLGRFPFRPGYYFYVGSAQRNLRARLARHGRRDKPLRWQIDYLSTKAQMLGALVIEAAKSVECKVAAALARDYARAIPRFGASDCRCPGHLFWSGDATEHAGAPRHAQRGRRSAAGASPISRRIADLLERA